MRIHPVVHVSQLAPYQDPAEFPDRPLPTTPPTPEIVDNIQEWVAEKVIAKRTTNKGEDSHTEYLVKWVGYPDHDNTWEPTANLANAQDAVKAFEGKGLRITLRGQR
jgi:hypothetical protein